MTPAAATRPVLIALTLGLAGCGAVEGDRHSFQSAADRIAAIEIPMDPDAPRPAAAQKTRAETQGLRPAKFSPVKIALMTPYEMWDARDAMAGRLGADERRTEPEPDREPGLRGAVTRMVQPAVQPAMRAAAPALVEAVDRADRPVLRPAVIRSELRPTSSAEGRLIQLGAFSSEAAARAAWARLRTQADLSDFSPRFEDVEVAGRRLTRLRVGPIPTETASALCAAAQVADPWCRRAG